MSHRLRGRYRSWFVALVVQAGCEKPEVAVVAAAGPLDLVASLDHASTGSDAVALDLGTPGTRRYLGHGWARDGQSPHREFVWGLGESSLLRVHLRQPGHVSIAMHARPFGDHDLTGQAVTLLANKQKLATIPLDAGWSHHELLAPQGVFHDGENSVELRYAWSAVPAEISESADERALAVAFDSFIFLPDSTAPGEPDDRPRAVAVDFGTADARRHLDFGWGGRESGGDDLTYAWATGRRAQISVDLGRPVRSELSIRVRPFSYPGAPSQVVEVLVNGETTGTWILTEGWQDYTAELPASLFRVGSNTIQLSFSHVQSPFDLGNGDDHRTLAAAFDWLSISPLVNPAVSGDGSLELPLGVRVAFPLTLPPSSVLDVEMAYQNASLVVELKDMRSGTTESWSLRQSERVELSGADDPTRVMQLSLMSRRGEQAESVVLDSLTVESTDGHSPSITGLRPRTPAIGDDPPGSQ